MLKIMASSADVIHVLTAYGDLLWKTHKRTVSRSSEAKISQRWEGLVAISAGNHLEAVKVSMQKLVSRIYTRPA